MECRSVERDNAVTVRLANLQKLSDGELRLYLMRDFPGPDLGPELGYKRILHPEVHDQLRAEAAKRGLGDVVYAELRRIRNRRRGKKAVGSVLTMAKIRRCSTNDLIWFYEIWARPRPTSLDDTIHPKDGRVLQNIASELTRRRCPLPFPLPDMPRMRRAARRTARDRVNDVRGPRTQVITSLGRIARAMDGKPAQGSVLRASLQLMAALG